MAGIVESERHDPMIQVELPEHGVVASRSPSATPSAYCSAVIINARDSASAWALARASSVPLGRNGSGGNNLVPPVGDALDVLKARDDGARFGLAPYVLRARRRHLRGEQRREAPLDERKMSSTSATDQRPGAGWRSRNYSGTAATAA